MSVNGRPTIGSSAWLNQVLAFAERHFRTLITSKIALFWTIGFPAVWYVMTTRFFVGSGTFPQAVVPSIKATYGVTFGLFGAFTVVLVSFVGEFTKDLEQKRYRKFRSMSISPLADLTGRFIAGFGTAIVSFVSILLFAALDGARYSLHSAASIPIVFLSLLLFSIIGMVLALLIASLVSKPEFATTISTGILIVVFFVTGYNGLDTRNITAYGSAINYLPNSLVGRLQMHHLVDTNFQMSPLTPPPMPTETYYIGILGVYTVVSVFVGKWAMEELVYNRDLGE